MKMDYAVVGFIVNNYNVLLVHHAKHDMWLPPGGHVEKNEDFDAALLREIKEETNLDVDIISFGMNWEPRDEKFGGNVVKVLSNPFNINVHKAGDHLHLTLCYICSIKNDSASMELNLELKGAEWFTKGGLQNAEIPKDVRKLSIAALEISLDNI